MYAYDYYYYCLVIIFKKIAKPKSWSWYKLCDYIRILHICGLRAFRWLRLHLYAHRSVHTTRGIQYAEEKEDDADKKKTEPRKMTERRDIFTQNIGVTFSIICIQILPPFRDLHRINRMDKCELRSPTGAFCFRQNSKAFGCLIFIYDLDGVMQKMI